MNVKTVFGLATFPARLAHELTHVIAGLPWAERWQVRINEHGADARIQWREGTPGWAVALHALAPLIIGCVVAGLALGQLATGRPLPQTIEAALWWTLGTLTWLLYTLPSDGDRTLAKEAMARE